MTGKFRHALHAGCNLSYHNRHTKIPVFFHNGNKYDTHLFIKELCHIFNEHAKADEDPKHADRYAISIIPKTSDNYISIGAGKFHFMDSLSHLTASLEKLVESLKKSGVDKFTLSKERYGDDLKDFLRKGVYPYEYMDSWARFDDTQCPPQSAFHSSLKHDAGETISNEDYAHFKFMWDKYCKSMRDMHDLYLESDVYLLADVFENYRKMALQYYEIDPAWLITAPGASWTNMLKKTNQTIEVFNNKQKDMHLMVEKGIRGGISCIVKRFSEEEEDKVLHYFDANNLYGWAMIQSLPYGEYKWEDASQFTNEYITQLPDDGDKGYTLEVDFHVDESLHDYLRDYPPAPEHCIITDDMLSPYTKGEKERLEVSKDTTAKLILSLRDKKQYVIHYRLLKYYMQLGVQVTKVHRVISFKQSQWLKPYIEFNTEKRKQCKTDFEKDFFKLLNNSVFGKFIENVRKRSATKVYGQKHEMNYSESSRYKNHKIFSDDLVAIEFQKTTCKLDKPIIVGQAILDLSKLLMYEAYYTLKRRYNSIKLLMTDTDSFILELPRKFDEDLKTDRSLRDMFDLSEFPQNSPYFETKNKKVVGKFKDEMAHGGSYDQMLKFVGLRAKMYCCLTDKDSKFRAKGISKTACKQYNFEKYKNILMDGSKDMASFNIIRARGHNVYTAAINKVGLSAYDNKFYQINNIESVPYGYRGALIPS